MDRAQHPALLMVDTISSLGSMDYRHEEWGVDVTVGGSQKGVMLPPGLSFNAISEKALAANKSAKMGRVLRWDWQEMLKPNRSGFFPSTRRRQIFCGDYGKRWPCCMKKGWTMRFTAISAMLKPRARLLKRGDWKCGVSSPRNIPVR